MSKAFTKEDDALPERSVRRRSTSGLPPGAVNYMTADGARRLRAEIPAAAPERAAHLRQILASITVVEPPGDNPDGAIFGATVTVRDASGGEQRHRIVGVDEVDFEPGFVSWTSPNGRALLGTAPGHRVALTLAGESREFTVVRIEY